MTTPTLNTATWLALRSRIDTIPTSLTRYDPGATIDPPVSGINPAPYILVSDARNDNQRLSISGAINRRSGVLMLSVQWPVALSPSHAQLVQTAGAIAEHFPADVCMSYGGLRLRVTTDADTMQPYRDGAYHVAVVRVPWEVLHNRA